MILSDKTILERLNDSTLHADDRIEIAPFDIAALQGASVDLKLGLEIIDESGVPIHLTNYHDHTYFLYSGQAVLAHTFEHVKIPTDCVARVEGKSSIGRQFVIVHCTAGWIDPGFYGNITLEIVNHSAKQFQLTYGMFICQLTFLQLDQPAERVYKGRYQGDKGAQGAKP